MTDSPAVDTVLQRARTAFATGDILSAFAAAGEVLTQTPESQEARVLRVNAALKLERWQDAIAALDPIATMQPSGTKLRKTLAACWLAVANAHRDKRETESAAAAYRKAIQVEPDFRDARFNLGALLLENGELRHALAEFEALVSADSTDTAASLKLAEVQLALDATADARRLLERIAQHARSREHLQRASVLLLEAGSADAAKTLARRLIEEQPQAREWARTFCRKLRANNDLAGSRELLSRLRLHADDAERVPLDIATALGLPPIHPDRETLLTTRADYLARLDALVAAYPPERIAAIAPTPEALLWDNFYLAYQGENDREPQHHFGEWLARSLQVLLPQLPVGKQNRARPRLAIVSSRLHECTVGAYFASWIEYLAAAGWVLILVHIGDYRDALSERLAARAHAELTLTSDVKENSTRLHGVAADLILYPEIGMDYRTLGLAAQRLAPVQVCAWGHPITTGLPTIDVFLSCAEMEPEGAQAHYSERLLALPGLGTRYLTPAIPSALPRDALGLPTSGTLYLVPQSIFKLHPDNDSILVQIAQRDGDARFVFFAGVERGAVRAFRTRLACALNEAGIDPGPRLLFLPECSRADYLRVNLACNVMLDSLHWSGGNASLDALHCGLPIVTCPGRFMRGRQSMAMLRHLDCAELVVERPQQLAELATEIAHDRSRSDALAAKMRANLPALTQSEAPLQALDALLKNLVADS